MFLNTKDIVYDNEFIEFHTNLTVLEYIVVISSVHGVNLISYKVQLGEIVHILYTR